MTAARPRPNRAVHITNIPDSPHPYSHNDTLEHYYKSVDWNAWLIMYVDGDRWLGQKTGRIWPRGGREVYFPTWSSMDFSRLPCTVSLVNLVIEMELIDPVGVEP